MANKLCIHMSSKKCPRQNGIFCTSYVCAMDDGKLSSGGELPSFMNDLFKNVNPFGFGFKQSDHRNNEY